MKTPENKFNIYIGNAITTVQIRRQKVTGEILLVCGSDERTLCAFEFNWSDYDLLETLKDALEIASEELDNQVLSN